MRGGGGGVGLAYLIPILSIVLIWCGAMPMQCRLLPHEAVQGSYYSNDTISGASAVNYTSRDNVNSTSRGDDSKVYLKFCTEDFCKLKLCYCCQLMSQPGHITCYGTRDDCTAMCPACNPKCPP
ncbi:hypothetical protein PVAP13_5NG517800 [Panicum virgatum]|uniref:Uncharacterized protein n=1 Tax=Panicum virgatum TaxID=38727 RepID=A0A8T0S650_PANVG|nr:hypothetical protein PVAP13_5NG517800 [Panicum virgatum]